MYNFPDLSKWFDFSDYKDLNSCSIIELNMKANLSPSIKQDFYREYANYICRLRCINSNDIKYMHDAIEHKNGSLIPADRKEVIIKCFFTGFISETKYQASNDYRKSFDGDAILGYLGECFYYLVREQYLQDEKVLIEPFKPKFYSKTPGIDFLEIRKRADEYYMIIGEIKTTTNSISSRSGEIIKAFALRADKTFAELYQSLQHNTMATSDPALNVFIERMNEMFYYTGKNIVPQKKYSGVIGYDYHGQKVHKTAFSDYKDGLVDKVFDSPDCRRIKLVGIYNIGDYFDEVRDIIWDCLLT